MGNLNRGRGLIAAGVLFVLLNLVNATIPVKSYAAARKPAKTANQPKKNENNNLKYLGQYVDDICVSRRDFNFAKLRFNGVIEEVEKNENRKLIFDDEVPLHYHPGQTITNSHFNEGTSTIDQLCVWTKSTIVTSEKPVKYYGLEEIFKQLKLEKQNLERDLAFFLYGVMDESSLRYNGIFEDPLYKGPSKEEFKKIMKDMYLGTWCTEERIKLARNLAKERLEIIDFIAPFVNGDILEMKLSGKDPNLLTPELKSRQKELIKNFEDSLDNENTEHYSDMMDYANKNPQKKGMLLVAADFFYQGVDEAYYAEMFASMAQAVFYLYPEPLFPLTNEELVMFSKMEYNGKKIFPLLIIKTEH